eukprot:8824544-Pyramimonas_sp.AAC.1
MYIIVGIVSRPDKLGFPAMRNRQILFLFLKTWVDGILPEIGVNDRAALMQHLRLQQYHDFLFTR